MWASHQSRFVRGPVVSLSVAPEALLFHSEQWGDIHEFRVSEFDQLQLDLLLLAPAPDEVVIVRQVIVGVDEVVAETNHLENVPASAKRVEVAGKRDGKGM